MSIIIKKFVLLASNLLATTYGHGELMCGDIGNPAKCEKGAVTASGVEFDPEIPMAAVAAPTRAKVKPIWIWLQYNSRPCVRILLADKMNPRYIGRRGFDLTPAAVKLLTGQEPTTHWSGKIRVCRKMMGI